MSQDNNNRGLTNTEYTSVTFDEIKRKLINRSQTYYPDTYRDFSKTSFGSLMFDLVAMVGEQLNFYAQFVANEGFVEFARTGIGLTQGARRAGVYLGDTPPQGTVRVDCPMVVGTDQITPDPNGGYIILAGTLMSGESGATVELAENIVINPAVDIPIATTFTEDGTRALVLHVTKEAKAIAGTIKKFVVEVGPEPKSHIRINIPDPSCSEILSIFDANGNEYSQVDNLSYNVVTKSLTFKNADSGTLVEKMIDMPVPRRFRFYMEESNKFIEFGYGSEKNLKISEQPADSKDFFLQKPGHRPISERVILPEKYLESDKYGVAPNDTTLTITYRSNTSENSNITIGGINTITSAELIFDNEIEFGEDNINFIRNNLSCINTEPFNGLVRFQSTKEIAMTCQAAMGAQGRAVTEKDFVGMSYAMPPKYGKIKKSSIYKDVNGLRKNLNMYCIAEDSDGNLQKPSSQLRENLRTWLSSVKMMTDTVDVFDAEILNLGLSLDITLKNKEDMNTALPKIRSFLYEELTLTTPEIGQPFSIGEVERILNLMPLVQRVNEVKVRVKNGTGYSNTRYNISGDNVAPDGSMIYMPENFVWEIKNQSDITGIIK